MIKTNYFIRQLLIILCWVFLFIFGRIQTSLGQDRFASNEKVTLSVINSDMGKILSQIIKQVKTNIVYLKIQTSEVKIARFSAKNESLQSVLNRLVEGTRMQAVYSSEKQGYIISFRKEEKDFTAKGKILDGKTKSPLPGVTIRIGVGINGATNGVITDANGNFSMQVPSGTKYVEASYIGYKTQKIELKGTGFYTVSLTENSKLLSEVVVSARRRLNNEGALLTERKNSGVVSDGISAKNIEKTGSITTAQALQRVSGVTITDDKYVAIRGLGDRSVIAELNGSRLSSSDPDRSSVPLDLVPAALLDNVNVIKTLTPDRPSDASAGIIELKTKSVPDSLVLQFTAETGTNSTIGLGGKYNNFLGGDLGALGQNVQAHNLSSAFLNLTNQYPGGVNQISNLIQDSRNNSTLSVEAFRIDGIMKSFQPVLKTTYEKVVPNQIYALNFGNSFKIFHGHTLGLVVSLSYYNRTEDESNSILNQYSIYKGYVTGSPLIYGGLSIPTYTTPNDIYFGKYLSYNENKGTQTLNYGSLIALTYKITRLNEISFQYLGSWGAEAIGSNLLGSYQNTGNDYPIYNQIYQLKLNYRTFRNFNLQGEHKLWNGYWAPQISWSASSSNSSQNQPDNRSIDIANLDSSRYGGPLGAPIGNSVYSYVTGVSHIGTGASQYTVDADPNGRFYRKLNENNYNGKLDINFPTKIFNRKINFKLGGNYLKRDRQFTENVLRFPYSSVSEYLLANTALKSAKVDLNQLIGYSTIGILNTATSNVDGSPRQVGYLYQIAKSPNNYTGKYKTEAFYFMTDAHITDQIRLIGGVRFESTDIESHVDTTHVTPINGLINPNPDTRLKVDFNAYYSGTLIYQVHKNMNFRLAYSTSLARPELREITNIFEYDPFQSATVAGNPNLINQFNRSEDFRWEWFPSSGEVFSLSLFSKQIQHQLTKVFTLNSLGDLTSISETPIIEYQNDENKGNVYGMELEVRKNLGKLNPLFKNLYLGTNVLVASSYVVKNGNRIVSDQQIYRKSSLESPLFEQAPYSINAYLDYDNAKLRTNITSSFNIVGQRLTRVQLDGLPDIYSRPVPLLDFVFSQHLGKRFLIKGFAKNILNAAYEDVYTVPNGNGDFKGKHYTQHLYHKGTEYELGISYNIF